MDELITIPFEHGQILFDALVGSLDYGSGMLDTDEVEALRNLAVAIGVDPNKGTPDEFRAHYPHPFMPETDRVQVAWLVGALSQETAVEGNGFTRTVNVIDDSKLPDHPICKAGSYNRKCTKPEIDPIHVPAQAAE